MKWPLVSAHEVGKLVLIATALSLVACTAQDSVETEGKIGFSSVTSADAGPFIVIYIEFGDGDFPQDEIIEGQGQGLFGPAYARYELIRALDNCGVSLIWLDTTENHYVRVVFPSVRSRFHDFDYLGADIRRQLLEAYDDVKIVQCVKDETHISFRPGVASDPDNLYEADFSPFEKLNAQTH